MCLDERFESPRNGMSQGEWLMDRVSESLGETKVFTVQNQPVHMKELWADGPALITFLRHFG
jgi:hypothetical protein